MSKSWECALALRRAASCRRRVSIPIATRYASRPMSTQMTQAQVDPKQITPRPELLPRRSTEQWNKQDDVLVQHLNHMFSPLQFPPELASRILTHASHPDATRRHNARLSFVGRRVLQSYLLMFIHSSPALRPDHDFEKFISHALNTYTLGELVAPKWELGKVTKWKPMNVGSLSRPLGPDDDVPSPFADVKADNARSIGMYKVHGTTVEAVVGGVFHQFGGAVAHRLFHTRLLPHLCVEGTMQGLHAGFHEHALEVCEKMGGRKGPLLRNPCSATFAPSSPHVLHVDRSASSPFIPKAGYPRSHLQQRPGPWALGVRAFSSTTTMTKTTAPYGTWMSPVTPDVVLKSSSAVSELFVDPIASTIYHIEKRPAEAGRNAIVDTEKGEDVVGKEWNARTGVHEYGGASAIAYNGIIYFSHFKDGRVYRKKEGEDPVAITPENKNHRFAQFAVHPKQTHLLVAILEDHTKPQPADVVNTLIVINSEERTISPLVSGADFYSNPRFSPDGARIAWQQWFHPDMSWEGCEINIAEVHADTSSIKVAKPKTVAGKPIEISAINPSWASSDVLLFVSDKHGYWNPWKYSVSAGEASAVLPKPVDEDFAEPGWQLSFSFGTPLDSDGKYALFTALKEGRNVLYLVSLLHGALEELECPYVHVTSMVRVTHEAVVFQGSRNDGEEQTVLCTIKDYAKPKFTPIGSGSDKDELPFARTYVPEPQSFALQDAETGEPSHVIFYPPANPDFTAPEGERPPAIFYIHGGPTSRTPQGLSYKRLFYTTRGWAWVDVNYGGSSGYGRKYTKRLEGQWGIADVHDGVVAVKQLSSAPYFLVDPQRTAITGGSAGGYTVLKTLCSYPDAFAAGTSSYGISDFFKLAEFTHKFESQYLFKLVGGTPEQVPDVYKERSPVFLADKIKSPLLVLQGSEDAVVPPNQAEGIVETIRKRGGRVEYTVFQGEGHGWRREENIRAALEKELAFYEDVFGLRR